MVSVDFTLQVLRVYDLCVWKFQCNISNTHKKAATATMKLEITTEKSCQHLQCGFHCNFPCKTLYVSFALNRAAFFSPHISASINAVQLKVVTIFTWINLERMDFFPELKKLHVICCFIEENNCIWSEWQRKNTVVWGEPNKRTIKRWSIFEYTTEFT